jgi:hypothetical protein
MAEFNLVINLNALRFFSFEDDGSDWENVISDLLGKPLAPVDLATLKVRYGDVQEETQLFAFPAVPKLDEKLLQPLRNAKAAYVLGNYLATIALCGMVAEMAAIILYEVREFTINAKPLDDEKQRGVFGSTVEKMGQERKIQLLSALGTLSQKERDDLWLVKEIRRKYLHLYSHTHENAQADARAAFIATASVIASMLGLGVAAGKITLDERFVQYLRKIGFLAQQDPTADSAGVV